MVAWQPEEITKLRDMALAGASEEETAVALKRCRHDVREMAALLGVSFSNLAKHEWCPLCAHPRAELDPDTGWCYPCTAKARLELQELRDHEEEERLRREVERADAKQRKRRERMRERYDANPRKGGSRAAGEA